MKEIFFSCLIQYPYFVLKFKLTDAKLYSDTKKQFFIIKKV